MNKQPFNSGLMQMLSHLADLMLVNILWLLCSIPVFTIGASTTAMYSVTMKLHKGEGVPVGRNFLQAFRVNFKVATVTWLIMLIPSVLVFGSVAAVLLGLQGDAMVVRFICLVVAGVFWLASNYVYPLTAYFDNTIRRTLLNSLLMVFGGLLRAIQIGAYSLIPFVVYLIDPGFFMRTLIFWMIAGIGIIADLQSRVFRKVFANYLPPKEENSEDGEDA